jgi:glycosyltransferase involved in cell wall biosynthesis
MINGFAVTAGIPRARLIAMRDLMKAVLPGADVRDHEGHRRVLALPEPNARHVLAAATTARATTILAWNLRHFQMRRWRAPHRSAVRPSTAERGTVLRPKPGQDPVPHQIAPTACKEGTAMFSLVVATFGRGSELHRLLDSLIAQTYQGFEVIVVDQNEGDAIKNVVDAYRGRLNVIYLRSARGLSRARNVALAHVRGGIVAFPDDDCWYSPDLLERVAAYFSMNPAISGLTGMAIDEKGNPSNGRWGRAARRIDRRNVWSSATSYTIFLTAAAIAVAGKFDETLGVGSNTRWGAGEEVDYLLRVLRNGYGLRYDPAITTYHCEPIKTIDDAALRRSRLYNRGFGRVLSIHGYTISFVLYLSGRAFARAVISLARFDLNRARFAWIAGTQRLLGWADRPRGV